MSSDEEDAFGPKKEKVEEDPVKSKIFKKQAKNGLQSQSCCHGLSGLSLMTFIDDFHE